MTASIEAMAREAGVSAVRHVDFRRANGQAMTAPEHEEWEALTRFAALVRAQALEDAARLCDAEAGANKSAAAQNNGRQSDFAFGRPAGAEKCAAAIRALP